MKNTFCRSNRKHAVAATAALTALAAAVAGMLWLHRDVPVGPPNSAVSPVDAPATTSAVKKVDPFGPYTGLPAPLLWAKRPKMYRLRGYPPTTEDGIRMWQWWRAMRKADPSFEWKTPIEFYGRVVDQSNQPVADARVVFNWTAVGDSRDSRTTSDTNGLFRLSGVTGKNLGVRVSKEGYRQSQEESSRGYEYAAFFEPSFHIPDPTNPVVYRLEKMGALEALDVYRKSMGLTLDDKPVWFDVKKRTRAVTGDFAISVAREFFTNGVISNYVITVYSGTGAGIMLAQAGDRMFQAPEQGYQARIRLEYRWGETNFKHTVPLCFFLKTANGRYAALSGEVFQWGKRPEAGAHISVFYNPSGSRNLEHRYQSTSSP